MLYHARPAPPRDPEETDSEEELAAKRLMELHAADNELGFVALSQPKRLRRQRRRTRIDPVVVTAGEDEVREGGEEALSVGSIDISSP